MGEVYRARDGRLGRDIALKILPRDLASNQEALRRFEIEARAASALNHPNIVTIYEIDQEDSLAWIAMELIEGEDLGTLVDREPLTIKNALRIALKIADGLAAAHERGIVHRDLKPDNVMITRDGFVKILDFGLAKQVRILGSEDTTMPHTSPGAVFGTVGYMAPEQAAGREMDYRSDQFSFGVILYEMLTRARPFDRETKAESLAAIIRDEVEPPSALNDEIPEELDRLVMRCLQKKQRDRYGSTRDLAHDLREIRDRYTNSSTTHRSARAASGKSKKAASRRSRWAFASIAVALLAVAAVAMWMRHRTTTAARERVHSLAVLPFRDLSSTPEGRTLADGISEMIAARLAEVKEIRVASPFDVAPVAESDDAVSIAKKKNVNAIVRGSVRRNGDDVRVTYAIVDASGDTLASGSVTRAATDLFALEDAIAEEVMARLGRPAPARQAATMLGPEDQQRFIEAVGLLQRVKDEQTVDKAIATLEGLLRNARESGAVNAQLARALLFKATLARRPALIEQATVYATRGVTLNGDADSHTTLGMLQNASGRHADAVRSFERALALRPEKPDALVGLADAYAGLGRGADAEAMYRKSVQLRPDFASAATKFGMFLYGQGRHREAAAQFKRTTELMPDSSHAWTNYALALQALARYDEALAASRKSIAIKPTAPGWTNLGTLQFSLGKYAEARQSYERAAALAPSEPVTWMNLGDAHRAMKSEGANDAYARAIAAAREALAVNPNDARMLARVALCLAKSDRAAEAQSEIRKALELDPTNAQILYNAAVIATLRGNHDSAVSWLERAVASGYPAAEAQRDPELAPLRDLPPFRSAVN
jgi:serine/threonine protein kinase/Flp pilus assembly protein TadD